MRATTVDLTLLLTIPETARELRISPKSVYRLIAAKKLRTVPVGTGTRQRARVSREELERYKTGRAIA